MIPATTGSFGRIGRSLNAGGLALALTVCGCGTQAASVSSAAEAPTASAAAQPGGAAPGQPGTMTIDQTLSDQAQLTTIAFDGLAFLTGSLGSDSFFPPGKVADFWGFQYLRDNDPSGMGHNTDFLTSAALNVLTVLTAEQRAALVSLAKSQVADINTYAYQRFTGMSAFRRLLAGRLPAGTDSLSPAAVARWSAALYRLDGDISVARASVMGSLLHGLSASQRSHLDAMVGKGMSTWPKADEPTDLRSLTGDEKVAVMTYAADMFAWYAGNVEADVYFCPERQGTYFGSFYLKDAPAVGNPGYSIGTNITGDMGRAFLAVLTPTQRARITALVGSQRQALAGIVTARRDVAAALRVAMDGGTPDASAVSALMTRYGTLDATIVTSYANAFVAVGRTLTAAQRTSLMALRHKLIGTLAPTGAYLYSRPIPMPTIPSTTGFFTSTATPRVAASSTRVAVGGSVVVRVTTPAVLGTGRTTLYATPRGGSTTTAASWPTTARGSVGTVTLRPSRQTTLSAVHRSAAGAVRRSAPVVVTVVAAAS